MCVRSCLHFKIMGGVILTNKVLLIWYVILCVTGPFPTVLICSPSGKMLPLYLTVKNLHTHIFIRLCNFLLYVVISLLTHDVVDTSCTFGSITMIILVCFVCFTNFKMCTSPFSDSFFVSYLRLPELKPCVLCQFVNLLACYVCDFH